MTDNRPPTDALAAALTDLAESAAVGASSPDAITTGFPSVDTMLGGGVRRGDLIVVAGEVASGKSAMALAIALRASEAGLRAAFFTGEMSVARVLERALVIEGRVRTDDLRRGTLDEAARVSVAAAAVRLRGQLPTLGTLPVEGIDPLDVAIGAAMPCDIVVIDPLQWLAPGARARDEEIAAAVRMLKAIAVRRNIAIIVTTNLPELPVGRHDARPRLEDLGGYGAIKQFADVVLGLYRHAMYDSAADVDGATELIILKNRHGARGYVDLFFYKDWMRFEDMVEPGR
jgi:replicative DNA helicase